MTIEEDPMPLRSILAAALAALAVACNGGDVTPTGPAGDGIDAETPAREPGVDDPGGELEEPDPGDPEPTEQPGIETP